MASASASLRMFIPTRFGRCVDRRHRLEDGQLLAELGWLGVAPGGGDEVRPLGPNSKQERCLARVCTGSADIARQAVEVLPHRQWRDARRTTGGPQREAESLAGTDESPTGVEVNRAATFQHHHRGARWLHSLALVGERRRHSLDPGKSRQPEREIQQRTAEIEHCTAARLIALLAPTERSATRSGQEPPGANRFEIAELATLHERADHLHVGTIAVRQSRHYHP